MVDSYSNNPSSFKDLLCYNLASLPEHVLSKTSENLARKLQPVLFNLAVLHTAVALLPPRADDLTPLHYSNLLTGIDRLLSRTGEDLVVTLHSLSTLMVDMYSGCAPRERLQSLAEEVLSVESCSPNACIRPHAGVEVTTPTSAASLVEHVQKTAKCDQENSPPK